MALFQIGSASNMVKQASNALGSNAITNAFGIDAGSILTPSKFLTKFTPSTVFSYRSLAYEIRNNKNFDVIFHWFPKSSQIRSMFSNAFSASDTTELNLLIRSITLPSLVTQPQIANASNPKFQSAFPGMGVNGNSALQMTFLNTEFSFIDHCFYQWLSETESPYWIYGPGMCSNKKAIDNLKTLGKYIFLQEESSLSTISGWMACEDASKMIYLMSESEVTPFTRADIEVKYYSGNMKELHSVWFMGAFPQSIQLQNVDNNPVGDNDLNGYTVAFSYDSVCISSPFSFNSSNGLTNSVAGALGGLSNSSSWTAGLYDDTLTQIGNTYLAKASRKLNKIMNKTGNKVSDKLKSVQSKLTA